MWGLVRSWQLFEQRGPTQAVGYNTYFSRRHVFPYDAGSARVKPHYVTTVVKSMWNVDECCGCTCHVGMREH